MKKALTAQSKSNLEHYPQEQQWKPTIKEKKEPYPERLDNKKSMFMLLKADTRGMDPMEPTHFKKGQKELVDAKKLKLDNAREAEKQLKKQKRLQEEAELAAEEEKKRLAQPRMRKQLTLAERMQQQKP